MSRKIILNLAISLDGYIADENGGYDWITGDGDHTMDTSSKWDFAKFLKHIDIVVMGSHCYDQGFHKDFSDKTVFVATSKDLPSTDTIEFIKTDITRRILEEKTKDGKDIFLFGGGQLCDPFIKADIIDEYIIGIIPIILGKGIPLFQPANPTIRLTLKQQFIEEGIIVLHYTTA